MPFINVKTNAAVPADKLCEDYIMPEAFDPNVRDMVADAVKRLVK